MKWSDELDFIGPRVRTASWAWLVLLAGITAAAWAWPLVAQSDADLKQAQADLKRLQRAVHQQSVQAKAALVSQARGSTQDGLTPEAQRHAAQLAQWMGYPWQRVLAQVESAAQDEKTVMLSFSLDIANLAAAPGMQPEARMTAAVQDDESALRWAQRLGNSAQLRGRERLSQPFQSQSGAYEWRVEAAWSGDEP